MKEKLLLLLFLLSALQCTQAPSSSSAPIAILPLPAQLEKGQGHFLLNEETTMVLPSDEKEWQWVAQAWQEPIKAALEVASTTEAKAGTNVIKIMKNDGLATPEAYELSISPKEIIISAASPHGAFYGVQSLLQLLPNDIFAATAKPNNAWEIPCLKIVDQPRFSYRGMHLDVARHFFEIEEVKKYIDLLAMHKMNTFHWHLTEDQGWRIEIKKYPKLTEVGGFRNGTLIGHYNDQPHQFDGQRYGGFYTQEQVKEVVQYAAERFITVIPEIELPGHAQAAIAAYPELGCTGEKLEVWQLWGVSDNVFCPTEKTFAFLEDVLEEVMALFPGEYIHIGGDECPKTQWKESAFCQQLMKREGLEDEFALQSYFIQKIEAFINSKGKKIIGWDEILEGGLAPNATVMSWRGIEGGIEAAKSGHDVIMTPTTHCYFDYYQSDHPEEPLAIGGLIPLQKVYDYEPIPEELKEEEAVFVKGTQGNLWTEYIPNFEKLVYMAYPRACALAEVAWSPAAAKNFTDFTSRLSHHLQRLDQKGYTPANHLYDLASSIQPNGEAVVLEWSTLAPDAQIYYTLDGSTPTTQSSLYTEPIKITAAAQLSAQAFVEDQKRGRLWQQEVNMHKAAGKKIKLKTSPHPKYAGGGDGSIINGVNGSDERYGDAEWLGFDDGKNLELWIDLGQSETLNLAEFRFFKGEGQWIYLPKRVSVLGSKDGEGFSLINAAADFDTSTKVAKVSLDLKKNEVQYLTIIIENYGLIPEGRQGGGSKAWMFVDEITIN